MLSFLYGALSVGLVGCGGSSPKLAPSAPSPAYGPDAAGEAQAPEAAPASPSAPEARFGGGAHGTAGPAAKSAGTDIVAPSPAAPAEPGQRAEVAARKAPADSARGGDEAYQPRPQPEERPGLGTAFGETRDSRVTTAPFVRADSTNPFALGRLYYNDEQGIAAMSRTPGSDRPYKSSFVIAGGHLEVALRDGSGRFLTGFSAEGRDYVSGRAGERYSIFLSNRSPGRIEAVVSVDGLDVIDGRPAQFAKRGYLLDPYGTLEIDGFRRSEREVAAFRFSSVRDSYAERKHGDSRNVGVIGFAFFHENGDDPSRWPLDSEEVRRRQGADPFPRQFATPP
ncbi:MAG: hypothetical protein HY744_32410 [Deltaproteobacteria bacterium]|nr:hypothetical protein [Deltaproteobacteria bacterium]